MANKNLIKLEKMEEYYLNKFYHFMMFAKDELFLGFKTANEIRADWTAKWNGSQFDKGAERIVYSFFNTQGFGTHNSSPVGSDMFFETGDAFIHIDLKTVVSTNLGDGAYKHDIEPNQSSYQGPIPLRDRSGNTRVFNANLPFSYSVRGRKKPCLTYFIVILFQKENFDILSMYITCMPNGSLKGKYGGKVFSAAKGKNKNARFHWKDCQEFELLDKSPNDNKPKRIRVIHYDDKHNSSYKKKLTLIKQLYDEQNQQ